MSLNHWAKASLIFATTVLAISLTYGWISVFVFDIYEERGESFAGRAMDRHSCIILTLLEGSPASA